MKTMPIYVIMSLMSALPEATLAQDHCLLSPQKAICKTQNINLYVGPQSVEPGEDIFIAVETLTESMESSSARTVTIIDADTGRRFQADVNLGLAYIDIKAPVKSGRLVFTARIGDVKSSAAEVLVHAGRAGDFELMLEKSKGQLFVSSSIIADGFGNILDDGMTVDVELIGKDGVYNVLKSQIRNGRLGLHIGCDAFGFADARVRARIGDVVREIDIPSYICGAA